MKRELEYITFIDLLFLLILSFSGMTHGILSEVIYYGAFLIPIGLGLYFIRLVGADKTENIKPLGLTRVKTLSFIPLIFPILTAIFAISLLTSLIMGGLGFTDSTELNEALPLAILLHAVLPAVLEEALFRYIPLKLTLHHSPRWAVILSSLIFSLVHANLFRIPYAFAAGIAFALVDIMAGSILPSVILHVLNNTVSIILIRYPEGGVCFSAAMLLLSVISLVIIIIKKKDYRAFLAPIKDEGEASEFSIAPLSLLLITLFTAITNLFAK